MIRLVSALLLASAPVRAGDVVAAASEVRVPAALGALAAPLSAPAASPSAPGLGSVLSAPLAAPADAPALAASGVAAAPSAAPADAAAPDAAAAAFASAAADEPSRPDAVGSAEAAAAPAGPGRVRTLLARLLDPFGTKAAAAAAPVTEAQRLDRDFAGLDFWAQVGPSARAEIEGLRARRLSKPALKDYVRAEAAAAFERIKAARGTANVAFHYNLHGGARDSYVGAGIRASKGDIALRYTTGGDANDKVYFFQTAVNDPYTALDARNGEILFWPSRMGSALSVFALDAPELAAAMTDGRIARVGSISMDFHKGMRGVPYRAFLAPPLEVFVRTAKKIGLRGLSRDEETLATVRYLEAALTAGGAHVPGGRAAAPSAVEAAAAARLRAAAAAAPSTSIPSQFPLTDKGYLYHGTTWDDLVRVVESGGRMAPQVSQFSARARDSVEYAAERRRKLGRADNPEALLQFRFADLNPLVSGELFRPALALTDRGMPPVHAAYSAAVAPVPLSLMTPASKDSLLSWLRAQLELHPDQPKWAALLPRFEAALGASAPR